MALLLASGWLVLAGTVLAQDAFDPLAYVDPLIGASNGGNVFPGASLPYGMAKAVADTNSPSRQGGFTLDGSPVTGFSMMHDSGTGGSPSLGNFALFAYTNCPGGDIDRCVFPKKARAAFGSFRNTSVSAKPGTFGITLDTGIRAEMTTTQHAALFSFTFPSVGADDEPAKPLILQDLTDLADSRQDNASVAVDPTTGRITGSARFLPSFGTGNFVLHFCTDFHGAGVLDSGIFVDSRASTAVQNLTISRSINGYPLPGGAFVRFNSAAEPILVRTATSFISVERACEHAETEIPDFDFTAVSEAATAAWREKMSPIRVSTNKVDGSMLTNFYSGIYRTMINPQNYTGENPLWSSDEPYFDSFYCIWDLFRSQLPLLTITDPTAVTEMIRSLIDTYRHLGWLPDCRMSLSKGYTQGGSNADVVLADAYVKGLQGGINWDDGYAAVVKDAEVEPYDWCCEGRGGLDSWKSLGYIPVQDFDYKGFGTMTRSISRTLEYAYNDFCISQMAEGLGKTSDKEKYLESSGNWQNLFKADQVSTWWNGTQTGFTGFFQPRYLNKTWGYQDPLNCSNLDSFSVCSLQNTGRETFESSIWEYGFFVPHDQASLITLYGGPASFVSRLNYLHDRSITFIGNEPAFLTVFQYHYAGRPALSALRSHFYIPSSFRPTPDGLPGNDDSGAMGAFLAFAMIGLFPNPGQDVYLITPPFFEEVNVTHPLTGRTARVRALGLDPPAYANLYIQSATLDGRPYSRNWLDHSFFTEGKELVLTLGRNESAWGTRVEDLPPSLGKYLGFGAVNGSVARRSAPAGLWKRGADKGGLAGWMDKLGM
ncbi:glycoside hydrolase family 92 protein [Thermothielavioides terrestris NRRL 8126]|uniref:Glycoside hydrolase family 92 protein n=1 Tax=Thermothielavioides terrestris (strain ATCC 38088 / NRRL 8126) TaxID=578455 RepID=G2R1P2_THETT|nr:glycoside hydrolase family 92 protein [Thermothielavioides terrestris NRRL 8126]AEO66584.1 glycoside hydrolase family 92 protein [Thermothielavioides terrestris NRRL 8126]